MFAFIPTVGQNERQWDNHGQDDCDSDHDSDGNPPPAAQVAFTQPGDRTVALLGVLKGLHLADSEAMYEIKSNREDGRNARLKLAHGLQIMDGDGECS
jgi:hypothetical protein